MTDEPEVQKRGGGLSRRDLLRSGVIVGGTLVWSAPIIKSMALSVNPPPGSCLPEGTLCGTFDTEGQLGCVSLGAPCCSGFSCQRYFPEEGPRNTCTCQSGTATPP